MSEKRTYPSFLKNNYICYNIDNNLKRGHTMRLKHIKKDFKLFDGGSLKFKDQTKRKTYYFEMNYQQFSNIYKDLKYKRNNSYYILSSNNNHKAISFSDAEKLIGNTVDINLLIKKGNTTYGICNYEFMIELLSNMYCPEKDSNPNVNRNQTPHTYSININTLNNQTKPKQNSIFNVASKPKKERFDWAEAYEEGLRIFGDDQDEAEAYADEMKRKITGRI
jgi:hypothetical protein